MPASRRFGLAARVVRLVVSLLLVAALIPVVDSRLAPPLTASAANFEVNLTTDLGDGACDGTCTLRDAIDDANTNGGLADTITFSSSVTSPIVLNLELPLISEALTIDGSGQVVKVDGANAFRVFAATAPLTLTALSVQRGNSVGFGAGAFFGSTGVISAVNFISNTGHTGAGAYFSGLAIVAGSSFTNNVATTGSGGGLHIAGAASITGTTFFSNTTVFQGGGAYLGGTAAMTGTTFISNTAPNGGGAYFGGTATIASTTFTSNEATGNGGGADFVGVMTLSGTTFISNTAGSTGGGMHAWGVAGLTGGSFTGNSAVNGAGAYFVNTAAITGTTFLSNTAVTNGGGAYLAGTGWLAGAAFTGNKALTGGGAGAYVVGAASVMGTTFSRNTAFSGGGATFGTVAITSTTFFSNTASEGGGAFMGAASITGTTFMSNTATGFGGGGGAIIGGPTVVTGTTFISNTARGFGGDGGGAKFTGTASIFDSEFISNTTTGTGGDGGGGYFGNSSVVSGTIFIGNIAGNGNGGGAAFVNGTSVVTGTIFEANRAACGGVVRDGPASARPSGPYCGFGGGADFNARLESHNVEAFLNLVENGGGGFSLRNIPTGEARIRTANIRDNTAGTAGGGIFVANANFVSIASSHIVGNHTGGDGGGLSIEASALNLENSAVAKNTVSNPNNAAEITSANGATLTTNHVTFASVTDGSGRAVVVGTLTEGQAATTFNTIFHGYNVAIQGQSPTSTITISGVLWSSVNTHVQSGDVTLSNEVVGQAAFLNAALNDYHLTADSDAIDIGVNTFLSVDIEGNPRIVGIAPDAGAYEFQSDPLVEWFLFFPVNLR